MVDESTLCSIRFAHPSGTSHEDIRKMQEALLPLLQVLPQEACHKPRRRLSEAVSSKLHGSGIAYGGAPHSGTSESCSAVLTSRLSLRTLELPPRRETLQASRCCFVTALQATFSEGPDLQSLFCQMDLRAQRVQIWSASVSRSDILSQAMCQSSW